MARAVFHAHARVFEGRKAGANAAIDVPLCELGPGALRCNLSLGLAPCCFFSFIAIDYRRDRWLAERK